MAAANSKWARWVQASIAKHLHAAAAAVQLPLVVEFLDDRSTAWRAAEYKAEVTISGPNTRELSYNFHRVEAAVFIVISSNKQKDANAYKHLDFAGAMQNALDKCIEVKEYDLNVVSPATVGFLTPRTGDTANIPIDNLKPGDSDQLIHSVIEARYLGHFTQS